MTRTLRGTEIIAAEIVRHGLVACAAEMSTTLVRAAHNPLLYDAKDYCTAVVSAEAILWAVVEEGVLGFMGCLPDTVASGLARHGRDGFADGDVLIVNDPYLTGTHLSDTTVYAPVFADGDLLAFVATTAHWADIGGKTPGGWCPDSTDVYQEGICFTHQKLVASRAPNEALWELIEANVRYPALVRGDLGAQVAACRRGRARIDALCKKYGTVFVREAMAFAVARADAATRAEIAQLPDGCYGAGVDLDGDGADSGEPPHLEFKITVAGDRIRVSFDGTSEAVRSPINAPAVGTRAEARAALKSLLLPLDPVNGGHFLAIDVDLAPGLLVSAERPFPVDSGGYVGIALSNLTYVALAGAAPERCPAAGFQLFGMGLWSVTPRDGQPYILIDPFLGGDGANPTADGATLTFAGNGDVCNTPVEVMETRYPVRCECYSLVPGVAGAGTYRGGHGVRRDYRVLQDDSYLRVGIENTRDNLARGVAGGQDGAPSRLVAWPGTSRETLVDRSQSAFGPISAGEIVSRRSGGGGGWGPPFGRDPEAVARDVRDELLSVEEAAAVHGVVVEATDGIVIIDHDATAALRSRDTPT